MDITTKNYQFRAADDLLRIPFVVNVKDMAPDALNDLLDSMTDKLGAQYFRGKDLLMEVLGDQFRDASDPRKFLNGPFVGVFIKDSGEVRISSFDAPLGGTTVYALDQYQALASAIDGPLEIHRAVRRHMPRP